MIKPWARLIIQEVYIFVNQVPRCSGLVYTRCTLFYTQSEVSVLYGAAQIPHGGKMASLDIWQMILSNITKQDSPNS